MAVIKFSSRSAGIGVYRAGVANTASGSVDDLLGLVYNCDLE